MVRTIPVICTLILFHSLTFGATIWVPDDYSTIQGAIDAASSNDTIMVRQGTYFERIDFLGKAVTLEGDRGAEQTVIDGSQGGSVVTFINGETADTVLRGFTITNGTGSFDGAEYVGGGIFCDHASSPTLTENIFTNNYADFGGGGISCDRGSAPMIIDNVFIDNEAGLHGGGIYCNREARPRIEENRLEGNRAGFALKNLYGLPEPSHSFQFIIPLPCGGSPIYSGGGIYSDDGSPYILNNVVINNEGKGHGGGIMLNGTKAHPIVEKNTILQNVAEKGGGVYCCHNWSDLMIVDNDIHDNVATRYGGGICCRDQSTVIERNRIYRNAAELGGGIFFEHTDGDLFNNFLYENTAQGGAGMFVQNSITLLSNSSVYSNEADYGGGVVCTQNSEMSIVNTILSDNTALEGTEVWVGNSTGTSSVEIRFSLVKDGIRETYTSQGCELVWGARIIESDPRYLNPAQGDFHLTWLSPCINRGTFDDAPEADFEGDLRPSRGEVDIGPDEYANVHALDADTFQLPESGGTIQFALFADTANAHRNYLVLGTTSGNAPGVSLPGNLIRFPLNWDPMTDLILTLVNTPVFAGFYGKLDATGHAQATLNAPALPSGFLGTRMHFAFCLNKPFDFASNPLPAEIVR